MKIQHVIIAVLSALPVAPARAQHADVRPDVSNGQIITHGWVDDTSEFIPNLRVFAYDFQEDPEDPYFITDPGINTVGATALPPGEQLRFNILSADMFGLPSNLTYWDGTGPVDFGTPVASESLTLNFDTNNVVIGSGLGEQSGFNIQTIDEDGAVHRHLNSILTGGMGDPSDGIYLIAMELAVTGLQDSLPFFIVYNNGVGEVIHGEAIDWVTDNLLLGSDGNFNDDSVVDADDIDILWQIVRQQNQALDPGQNDTADLNDDLLLNEDDVDVMLAGKLTAGPNRAYGDANLSGGTPELTDYNLWRTGTGGWAQGDFDGSGGVPELNDYNLWRTGPTQFPGTVGEHGPGAPGAAPLVPEPSTIVLAGVGAMLLIALRRRSKAV